MSAKTVTVSRLEDVPEGEPARYLNAIGYVRLRWLVGTETYAECYEHRLVAGFPPADMEVHHKNRVKTDNRSENLVVLSKSEHAALHQSENASEYAARLALRKGYRSWPAFEKAERAEARRAAIKSRAEAMKIAYESGLSTTKVGEMFDLDHSQVSRHLRRIGTTMRPFNKASS